MVTKNINMGLDVDQCDHGGNPKSTGLPVQGHYLCCSSIGHATLGLGILQAAAGSSRPQQAAARRNRQPAGFSSELLGRAYVNPDRHSVPQPAAKNALHTNPNTTFLVG